jgi:hypothetical protein
LNDLEQFLANNDDDEWTKPHVVSLVYWIFKQEPNRISIIQHIP